MVNESQEATRSSGSPSPTRLAQQNPSTLTIRDRQAIKVINTSRDPDAPKASARTERPPSSRTPDASPKEQRSPEKDYGPNVTPEVAVKTYLALSTHGSPSGSRLDDSMCTPTRSPSESNRDIFGDERTIDELTAA